MHSSRGSAAKEIRKIQNIYESMSKQLTANQVDSIADTLRGLEGTAGRIYFGALSACIPTDYRFSGRSFRPALDPFNALVHQVAHAESMSRIGIEGLLNIVKSPMHLFVTISQHQHCPLQNCWPHQSRDAGAKNPIKNPLLL